MTTLIPKYDQGASTAVNRPFNQKLQEIVSVFDFMTSAQIADVQAGTMTQDVTTAINNAVAALPQTYDINYNFSGNQYSGVPGPILYFPAGTYKVTSSIVIQKNNVILRGDGWNNSIIKFGGTSIIQGVVRFLNALSCEMSDMGIDGGLPYNPTLSETYGADAGLICDLTPFFTSRNLWIANARKSGLVAIHLWESFFENLQVRNTGYFTNESTPVKGAALYFCADPAIKQSSNALGAGYESDNTVFVKAKLVPVGAVVLCEAPTANITLIEPITENRDFATYFAALSYTKYTITSANNFKIQGGYFYGHEHSFACNSTLFLINSGFAGIVIKDFYSYTSVSTVGYYPEVTKIINGGGVNPFNVNGLIIDDASSSLTTPITILTGSGYVGTMYGNINYNAPSTVAPTALFTGSSLNNYLGTISSQNTTSNTSSKITYQNNASQFDTQLGSLYQSFNTRAWVSFNGTTSTPTIRGSGNVSSVTKSSTGVYVVNYTVGMPDANYATLVSANQSTSASEIVSFATPTQFYVVVTNKAGATYYDETYVSCSIIR